MADWRQIQARIRKAKNSPDAPSKLSELFQRTRDAMVAWELGAIEEKAGHNEEAGRWYLISAQRFRRADWKKKAEEALTRLGIELPAPGTDVQPPSYSPKTSQQQESRAADPEPDHSENDQQGSATEATDESAAQTADAESVASVTSTDGTKKKRRRGRRGGRGRRKKGAGVVTSATSSVSESPAPAAAESRADASQSSHHSRPSESHVESFSQPASRSESPARGSVSSSRIPASEHAAPMLPSERAAHGRGDPALASRLSRLESMLRRLVSSPLHTIDQADEAPAGPGVFLLSDSDQITSYYVEACQTLRVGIGNLARGSRNVKNQRGGGRGYSDTSALKARLAEHLEINEAKVSQYLKDHCVIRWIQLDDDAPLLAHFAIAVLRTPLNVD